MKSGAKNNKEHYRRLRLLTCDQLRSEIALFDAASPKERIGSVALIRAVGVVFSETGSAEQKSEARQWLLRLLRDPDERIRRYAMAAIPKVGAGPAEEAALLSLLRRTTCEREKKFLGQALDKIGGTAALEAMIGTPGLLPQTVQKIKASVARHQTPSAVRLDSLLSGAAGLRIRLRCRDGLEPIVREEVEEYIRTRRKFRLIEARAGCVEIVPVASFSLADIYSLRCFGTIGLVPGTVVHSAKADAIESLASVIASPLSQRVLQTFTEGSVRYRLDFVSKGHQRSAVRLLANRIYALCPTTLNDARSAPWEIQIRSIGRGSSVELCPKGADPRFSYRQKDVPAASHPPLAACMARLAARRNDEVVWDPFCGSGLELIERSLRGGVRHLYGTDLSTAAIDITQKNFSAANLAAVATTFACCDFRDFASVEGLGPGAATLIITNPPMGKRVAVADLRGLIRDLFAVAAIVLRPGGRLVFANPLWMEGPQPSMKLHYRQVIDMGGFNCRLEMHEKT